MSKYNPQIWATIKAIWNPWNKRWDLRWKRTEKMEKKIKINFSSLSILEVKKFKLTNETEQRQTREKGSSNTFTVTTQIVSW